MNSLKSYQGKDFKVLWHNNYYDIPLSGCLLTKDNQFLFFECVVQNFYEINCENCHDLRSALVKYADHLPSCTGRNEGYGEKGRPCSCGYGFEDGFKDNEVLTLLENTNPENEDFREYDRLTAYVLYKPTEEQKQNLIHNHNLFEQYVGNHNNWDYRWNETKKQPREEHYKFYKSEDKKPNPVFDNSQIVGLTLYQELMESAKLNNQFKQELKKQNLSLNHLQKSITRLYEYFGHYPFYFAENDSEARESYQKAWLDFLCENDEHSF